MPRSKNRKSRKPAAQLGRRGGRARADRLDPERRTQIAQRAAKTRWQGPQPDPEMPGKVGATVSDVIGYYDDLPGFMEGISQSGTPFLTAIMTAHADALLERHPGDPQALKEAEHVRDIFLKSTEGRMMASIMEIEARMPVETITVWKRSRGSDDRIPIDQADADRGPGWYYDTSRAVDEKNEFFVAFPRGPFESKDEAQQVATTEFEAQAFQVEFVSGEPKAYERIKRAIKDYDPYMVLKRDQIVLVPYVRGGMVYVNERRSAGHHAGMGFVTSFERLTMHRSGRLHDWVSPGVLDSMTSGEPVDFDAVQRMFDVEADESTPVLKRGRPAAPTEARSERPRQRVVTPTRYEDRPDGSRVVKLSPEIVSLIEAQLALFKEKFGREPEGHDPIFFDPDADTPQPYPEEKYHKGMMETLSAAGCPPEFMYAYEKCRFMVTPQNWHMWDADDLAEWEAALAEYHEKMETEH